MSQDIFSDFYPNSSSTGAKGSSIAIITSAEIAALEADISNLAEDDILSGYEKSVRLLPAINELFNEWSSLDTAAGLYTSNSAIVTARATAQSAKNTWDAYLSGLTPAYNNITVDTPITRTTFNTYLQNYANALSALSTEISKYATTVAKWSGIANDNGAKASDYAGTTNTYTQFGAGTGSRQGNTFSKTSSGGTWDVGWCSNEVARGNASVGLRSGGATKSVIFGVANSASRTTALACYGIYLANNGFVYFWNGLALGQGSQIGSHTLGDQWAVTYDGVTLRYYKNGALVTSSPYIGLADTDVVGQLTLTANLDSITDFTFFPYTTNNWSAFGGDGKPADYATADLKLTLITSSVATITGNSLKASGSDTYLNAAVSTSPLMGARAVEADILTGTNFTILGFDDDITTTPATSSQVIYAYYRSSDGAWAVSWNNAGSASSGTITAGIVGKLGIYYDGFKIKVIAGTTTIFTFDPLGIPSSTLVTTLPTSWATAYYPKWYAYSANSTLTGLRAGSASDNTWDSTSGFNKPADYAGSSGRLTALGSYTVIRGNSIKKVGGTHGAEEGGVVGDGQVGSAFISSSLYNPGGGWALKLVLDDDNTTYGYTAGTPYTLIATSSPAGSNTIQLAVNGTIVGSKVVSTTNESRLKLEYDGKQVKALCDGVVCASYEAPSGLTLYPKVLHIYNDINLSATSDIHDIQYGTASNNSATSIKLYDRHQAGGSSTYSIIGNAVQKIANGGAWNYNVYSQESFIGSAAITARIQRDTFIGLTTAITDTDYTSITYGAHRNNADQLLLYINGSGTGALASGLTDNSIIGITHDGTQVQVFVNNVLVYTTNTNVTKTQTLYAAAAIFTLNNKVMDVNFQPWTRDSGSNSIAWNKGNEPERIYFKDNAIYQTSSSSSWNIWAYSSQRLVGQGSVSFRFTGAASGANGPVFGFASNSNKNLTNYTTTDYGLYFTNGSVYAMELGSYSSYLLGTTTSTDIWTIRYDGRYISYLKNGTIIKQTLVNPNLILYLKATFDAQNNASVQTSIQDIQITGESNTATSGDLKLTRVGAAETIINGTSVTNPSATDVYNYTARGEAMYGPCFAECDVIQASAYTMLSLDDDTINHNYAAQAITCHYNYGLNALAIYVTNGGGIFAIHGSSPGSITGKLQLIYDGVNIRVNIGGVERAKVSATGVLGLTGAIYPKFTPYTNGTTITGCRAGNLTSLNFADQGGITKPDPYATSGDNLIRNANLQDGTIDWVASGTGSKQTGTTSDPANFWRITASADTVSLNGGRIQPFSAGVKRLYRQYWLRPNVANGAAYFSTYAYNAAGSVVASATSLLATGAAANVWTLIKVPALDIPTTAVGHLSFIQPVNLGEGTTQWDIALPRVAPTEDAATLGATAGTNIFEPVGGTTMGYWELDNKAQTGSNKISNPDGEIGVTAPWTTSYLGGTVSLAIRTDAVNSGKNSFGLVKNATTSTIAMNSGAMAVEPGRSYNCRIVLKGNSATASGLYIRIWANSTYYATLDETRFTNSTGTGAYNSMNIENQAVPSTWTVYSFTWTCPANTYWASVNIINYSPGPTVLYVDDVYFSDVEPNADVTSYIDGGDITVEASSTGTVLSGQLPKSSAMKLWRNGVQVTGPTWSYSILNGTMTASIDSTGLLTVDASSGSFTSGKIRVTALYLGTTRTKDITVTKNLAQATSGGGGGGGGTQYTAGANGYTINSTTPATFSDELSVVVGASGNVTVSISYGFSSTVTNATNLQMYAQIYKWNGSSYVAVGSAVISTSGYSYFAGSGGEPGDGPYDGEGSVSFSDTGQTVGSTQKYKVYGYTPSGSRARYPYGTLVGATS